VVTLDDSNSVMAHLRSGSIDYGVLALFNGIAGPVNETVLALANSGYRILDQLSLDVTHDCYRTEGTETAQRVVGHIQALIQCRQFLDRGYYEVPKFIVAEGITHLEEDVRDGDLVLAPPLEKLPRGIVRLEERVQNPGNNQTIFVLVAHA
jgi:prephenate dehydratase